MIIDSGREPWLSDAEIATQIKVVAYSSRYPLPGPEELATMYKAWLRL